MVQTTNLDNLLQRLPGCVSHDLIDQLTVSDMLIIRYFCWGFWWDMKPYEYGNALLWFLLQVDFCYLNSKSNRKKIVRTLFNVPRTSLELLPYYSRMVATLSTCMKDVASMLLQLLEEEFNFLINKKVPFFSLYVFGMIDWYHVLQLWIMCHKFCFECS